MNENAKKWVEALRSGEYTQAKRRLRNREDGGDSFCCLGVACELYHRETGEGEWAGNSAFPAFVVEYDVAECDGSNTELPMAVQDFLGLNEASGRYASVGRTRRLSNDNDDGKSFPEIAAIIESEPEGLFR